tara:strand:+ start:1287 stop:1388 length:102 start_codon:yes stop_codon:yes gene_type:complete
VFNMMCAQMNMSMRIKNAPADAEALISFDVDLA